MRSREIVLPRNVPAENFTSAWSVRSEKNYSCSVLQLCIYSVVLVLVLGICGVVIFIVLNGKIGGIKIGDVYLTDDDQGEMSISLIW